MTQGEDYLHHLDFPYLGLKPSAKVLVEWLARLNKQGSCLIDFGRCQDNTEAEDEAEQPWFLEMKTQRPVIKWLTGIISSQLGWIQCESDREMVWTEASKCLAQRCGRCATPQAQRTIQFSPTCSMVILEPPLTEDNLGFKTWGSAYMLGCRLLKNHHQLLFDPVLELGSGTGVCGMVVARLGYHVTMTDLGPIVDNLARNVAINRDFISSRHKDDDQYIEYGVLDWQDPQGPSTLKRLKNGDSKYPCIVICDAIYSEQHPHLLINMIKRFLSPPSHVPCPRVLVQLPLRKGYQDYRSLFKSMLASQLDLFPIMSEVEYGVDDFGKSAYEFSVYTYNGQPL